MPSWRTMVNALTHSELVERALSDIEGSGTGVTDLNVGGIWRTLTEVAMQGIEWLWDELVEIVPQGYRAYAEGLWLDLAHDDLDLPRLEELKTEGTLRFVRASGASGNIAIPSLASITTQVGSDGVKLRYFVQEQTMLEDGETYVDVPVEAEYAGARYNVGTGYITELETPLVGIGSVSNRSDWITTEGRDAELDEAYRTRGDNRWPQLSRGATADAYRGWALDAGASGVTVDDQHPRGPGTVDVVITGPSGMPSAALVDQVQAYIDDGRRPQCADVLVMAPTEVEISGSLLVTAHPDTDDDRLEEMQAEAEARIEAFFYGAAAGELAAGEAAVSALGPGDDFALGRLTTLVGRVEDLYDVEAPGGQASVAITPYQLAVLGEFPVTVERAEEA